MGVIDLGFVGVPSLQNRGELPNLSYRDFTREGIFTETVHGSACAEIVHDIAPDAEIYLYKVGIWSVWKMLRMRQFKRDLTLSQYL